MNPLVSFPFSDDVRRAFTDGDCWVLAQTLEKAMSFPIVTANGQKGPWIHAANILPDGKIVDVEGVWEPTVWISKWEAEVEADRYYKSFYGPLSVKQWTPEGFHDEVSELGYRIQFDASDEAPIHAVSIKHSLAAQLR